MCAEARSTARVRAREPAPRVQGAALAVAAALLTACGARTGLRTPDAALDVTSEAPDAAVDHGPDIAEAPDVTETLDVSADETFFEAPDVFEEDAPIEEPDEGPSLLDVPYDVPVRMCNEVTTAGRTTPSINEVYLGRSAGAFTFEYDARTVADQFLVYYQGRVLFDSGCVRGAGTARLAYRGALARILVEVRPNCQGATTTSWQFTVRCPE